MYVLRIWGEVCSPDSSEVCTLQLISRLKAQISISSTTLQISTNQIDVTITQLGHCKLQPRRTRHKIFVSASFTFFLHCQNWLSFICLTLHIFRLDDHTVALHLGPKFPIFGCLGDGLVACGSFSLDQPRDSTPDTDCNEWQYSSGNGY